MGEAQNALSAAQGLLGVFTAAGLGLHDAEGCGANDERALKNSIQMLVDDGNVLVGPVHATCEALRALFGPWMSGHQLTCVKDLHRTGGESNVEPFADQPVRDRVIGAG